MKTSKKPKTAKAPRKSGAGKRPVRATTVARRADYGAPIDGFLARQAPPLRAILEELRRLIETAAPEAIGSLKWGTPFFSIGSVMM